MKLLLFLLTASRVGTQDPTPTGITIPNEQLRAVCEKYRGFHLVIGDNQAPDAHLVQLFYGGAGCTVEVWSTALKLEPIR